MCDTIQQALLCGLCPCLFSDRLLNCYAAAVYQYAVTGSYLSREALLIAALNDVLDHGDLLAMNRMHQYDFVLSFVLTSTEAPVRMIMIELYFGGALAFAVQQ